MTDQYLLSIALFTRRDISLRLTAIRETFEELGILICKRKEQLSDTRLTSSVVHDFDVEFWQKEVFPPANCIQIRI